MELKFGNMIEALLSYVKVYLGFWFFVLVVLENCKELNEQFFYKFLYLVADAAKFG